MTEISNSKLYILLKNRNSKQACVVGYWNLEFICNLVLGI